MIKKLIIVGIIIFGLIKAYQYFVAPTVEPFLNEHKGKINLVR